MTYTLTVTNTRQADYTAAGPASLSDDMTGVLDDATCNSDAAPRLAWSGSLAIGASVTITYSVTVNSPDKGDHELANTVTTPNGSGGNCSTRELGSELHDADPGPFLVLESASQQQWRATYVSPQTTRRRSRGQRYSPWRRTGRPALTLFGESAFGYNPAVLTDILIAALIVVVAAILGLVVHPLLWFIVILAVLWLVVRRGPASRR